MRGKQRTVEAAAVAPAALRWFQLFLQNDISTLSDKKLDEWASWSANDRNLDQFLLVTKLWQNLPRVAGTAPPTKADLDGDKYDASVSIAEWLARKKAPTGGGVP